jgi:hypothetical protein
MSTPSVSSPPLRQTPTALRERFRRLADQWKQQSRHLSNAAQMALLRAYQRIIGMGWPADGRASLAGPRASGTTRLMLLRAAYMAR